MVSGTTVLQRPLLEPQMWTLLTSPLKLSSFFKKGQHESIISKQPFSGVRLTSICLVYALMHGNLCVIFHRPHIYLYRFSSWRIILFWHQSPLSVLPSSVAQIWIDLAGQGRSGHQSHLHIEVMKEDSVPQQNLLQPQLQRWGGTQGTRWLASEETFTQLASASLAVLEVAVPACLTHCCHAQLSSSVFLWVSKRYLFVKRQHGGSCVSGCITDYILVINAVRLFYFTNVKLTSNATLALGTCKRSRTHLTQVSESTYRI